MKKYQTSINKGYSALAANVIKQALKDLNDYKTKTQLITESEILNVVMHDHALYFFKSEDFKDWCNLAGIEPDFIIEKIRR